jgi:predicted AAA+ superfamily ATPase
MIEAKAVSQRLRRAVKQTIVDRLREIECLALIGPRQIGKTCLALELCRDHGSSVYMNLELENDRKQIGDISDFFERHPADFIVLDEVQALPEIFPILKAHIDKLRQTNTNLPGRFLLLGSASLELQRQAAASLTGRYGQIPMSGLQPFELAPSRSALSELDTVLADPAGTADFRSPAVSDLQIEELWSRGGQPLSYLAATEGASESYRRSFLEGFFAHDVAGLGVSVDPRFLERFAKYVAATNGAIFSHQTCIGELKADRATVDAAVSALWQLLIVRELPPWSQNTKKRLTEWPRLYVKDSGLLHSLLGLKTLNEARSHNRRDFSWEGFVIEAVIHAAVVGGKFPAPYFFRTHDGQSELDLVLDFGADRRWAIEIKNSARPSLNAGNKDAADLIGVERRIVIHRGLQAFTDGRFGFEALPLMQALAAVQSA